MEIQMREGAFLLDQKMSDSMNKGTNFFLLSRILYMESATLRLNSNPGKEMLQKIYQLTGT